MRKLLFFILVITGFLFFPTNFCGAAINGEKAISSSINTDNSSQTGSDFSLYKLPKNAEGISNILPSENGFSLNLSNVLRGIAGMFFLLLIAYAFSKNKRAINWKTVGIGLFIQLLLAIGILYIPFVQLIFEYTGKAFVKILDFTDVGTTFLFGSGSSGEIASPLRTFAINILPTIIFFSAITSVLFYLGVIQFIVRGLGYLMSRVLGLSGAESLSVAGNIFLGQTESPLMIKEYLEKMNESEIMLVMSGGMATLAGGVLAAYIGFLGGGNPEQEIIFAKHLLAASVMAAPGVVVISKILVPQVERTDKAIEISQNSVGRNILDAIANGTTQGLKLAVNVAAMLLVFIAFIALVNYVFVKVADWTSLNEWVARITNGRYNELSLEFILGYSLAPLMWLIGVPFEDITLAGSLLGKKLIMTEFVAYISLSDMKEAGLFSDPKTIIMSVYMLCGFANFASIGIQIGGIGAIAPGKRVQLSRLGMWALLSGTLSALVSATIVGMLLG